MTINKFKKSKKMHGAGFTLIETLVAISILLIAIVGPISLIGDALHRSYYAKDEMIAINLAQEGVEAVRRVRDSNMLGAVSWLTNLANGDYLIDAGSIAGSPATFLIPCGSCAGSPQPVYFHTATGLYRQGAVYDPTQFSRVVTISGSGASERKATATVTWRTGGGTGSVSAWGHIFKTF